VRRDTDEEGGDGDALTAAVVMKDVPCVRVRRLDGYLSPTPAARSVSGRSIL